MDPEPTMTDHRKDAATALSAVLAAVAQVFATLDLADAMREASHA